MHFKHSGVLKLSNSTYFKSIHDPSVHMSKPVTSSKHFAIMNMDFLSLIWGRISAPFQFKNEQKRPKMVNIIPNFLALHFGEISWKSKQK